MYLLEEEMISQVIEYHGIGRVNGICSGEQLHPFLD